jgi:hypothetical protein
MTSENVERAKALLDRYIERTKMPLENDASKQSLLALEDAFCLLLMNLSPYEYAEFNQYLRPLETDIFLSCSPEMVQAFSDPCQTAH